MTLILGPVNYSFILGVAKIWNAVFEGLGLYICSTQNVLRPLIVRPTNGGIMRLRTVTLV